MIQLGREICGHLDLAQRREWLVTNGIGGYACGTIAGVLTRHYHGLLNAALQPPLDRTLLLAKLDATVTYRQQSYELQCDRWADGAVTGHGYRHLERFRLAGTVPTWFYTFQDALLVKQIWMEQGQNTTYIRYHLQRASAPVRLSLKVLVNYRNHHHSTQGQGWTMQIEPLIRDAAIAPQPPNDSTAAVAEQAAADRPGIKVTAFAGATPFYVLSDRGQYHPQHVWHRHYDLAVERYRGIDPHDDHLHGGTFEITLHGDAAVTLAATTAAPDTLSLETALPRQHQHEQKLLAQWSAAPYLKTQSAPQWIRQLVLAADQFVVGRAVAGHADGKTVIAGYPWFGDWGRDTMIALPGLAIATGRPEIARPILRTFAHYIDQGMLPNAFPEGGHSPGYNTVDAVLWYFEAVWRYYCASGDRPLIRELFPTLVDIIHWHQTGTRYNIHLDADGLIYAGVEGHQLTWMDAKIGDWVVTPRIGKPIEISALWYNALLITAQLANLLGEPETPYLEMAAHTRQGFQRFWSATHGYCYDVLDGPTGSDASLRPNQILAIALPARVLGAAALGTSPNAGCTAPALLLPEQRQAVVDRVAQVLLTSYGLRSLAPYHPDYCDRYGGSPLERDSQYHQGTVWSWLIGPFVQAHLTVYQNPEQARTFIAPFADHLRDGCIGTLSEIFDASSPFTPRGAFAQAWSVAEVLRTWSLIEEVATQQR